MKKVLSYILISLIISANLFAPISVGWNKNGVEIQNNKVEAADNVTKITLNSTTDHSIGVDGIFSSTEKLDSIRAAYYIGATANNLSLIDTKDSGSITTDTTGASPVYNYWFGETISAFFDSGATKSTNLIKGNTYFVKVRIIKKLADGNETFVVGADSDILSSVVGTPSTTGFAITDEAKTAAQTAYDNAIAGGATKEEAQQIVLGKVYDKKTDVSAQSLPPCGIGSLMGCVGQAFYYIIFQPTSYLFAMSGIFFDSSFAYSVQDSSYRSAFVVQGWGLVRDFCNLFFIFIMLYIAIGTILNLSSVKTKETIINVVIIGLFINFSLFATQIIIDASNITARVFYNSNSIKITEKGVTGATNVVSKIGEGGVIPLSSALVNKINPQNLIIHAKEINKIDSNSTNGIGTTDTDSAGGIGLGQFILIIIMASAVNIVGFVVFITVGFLFFARVIGLWLAMILAPLAFFTYIVPGMKDIKMIGWTKWWPETLKMAFLAPVFIFFMYLILKFLEMDLISDAQGKSGVAFFVAGMIPFVFIMIFMIKAKKIATDMSGEFGEMATKAGSAVGGMVLGGAVGMGAMAMRGTIGRLGSSIANSDRLKASEARGGVGGFFAKNLRNVGTAAGTGSFDARNTKAGSMAGSGMGVDMGKGKEGGFEKIKTDKIDKRVKRAKDLEKGEGSDEKREANGLEAQIRTSKAGKATDLARVEREITELRQKMQDQKTAGLEEEAAVTYGQLEGKQNDKKILRGAEVKNAAGVVIVPKVAGGIADLEAQLNDLNDKINAAEIASMNEYAKNMESMGNKTLNYITSLGQHSGVGANIAADRIRKGVKIEDKTK